MAIRACQSGGFQQVAAGQFVLAAGAWTDELLAARVDGAWLHGKCLGMPSG